MQREITSQLPTAQFSLLENDIDWYPFQEVVFFASQTSYCKKWLAVIVTITKVRTYGWSVQRFENVIITYGQFFA